MLDYICKFHNDWYKIAYSFLNNKEDAEDLVQNLYIRLHDYKIQLKKIKYKDDINRYFMYVTIRNMALQFIKKKTYSINIDEFNIDLHEEFNINESLLRVHKNNYQSRCLSLMSDYFIKKGEIEVLKEKQDVINEIETEIENWSFYDRNLFEIYMYSGLSLRDLAHGTDKKPRMLNANKKLSDSAVKNGTSISVSSMFNSIKELKYKLKSKIVMNDTKNSLEKLIGKSLPDKIVNSNKNFVKPFTSYIIREKVIRKLTDNIYNELIKNNKNGK